MTGQLCPYCDEAMSGRCDCGSIACVCGFCPRCEGTVDLDEDETLDGDDEDDEESDDE